MIAGMKTIVLAAAFAVIVPPMTAAQSNTPPKQAAKTPAVKALYGTMCQPCHGPEGKAPLKEMGFVGRKWKHGTKISDMVDVIEDGVPGTAMLPFKGRLTEQEIRDLARYVRSLDKTLKPEKR